MNYCPHWNLRCWEEENKTWEDHIQLCEHNKICWTCRQNNKDYHEALQEITEQQPSSDYYTESFYHKHTPWITCYNNQCMTYKNQKVMAGYHPLKPKRFSDTYPCWNLKCSCKGYQQHPMHKCMHWTGCFENDCLIYNKLYYLKLQGLQWPNWKANISATQWGLHLKLEAHILSQPTKVMIDSGATGNYMSPNFKTHLGLFRIKKTQPEPISELNSEDLGSHLSEESGLVHMAVLGHKEQINFNMTPLGQYNVVLGIPWLRNHNLEINWRSGQIYFMNCKCPRTTESGRESDTLPQLVLEIESNIYTKQSRGRLIRYQEQEPEDAATHIILAATKTSEWH